MVKNNTLLIIAICLCLFFPCEQWAETDQKYICVILPPFPSGMFNAFSTVAGFLILFEWGDLSGLKVDFGTAGLYYDKRYGSNWWSYYCEPIELGDSNNCNRVNSFGLECVDSNLLIEHGFDCHECIHPPSLPEFYLSRIEAYELIRKYIKIKPHILSKVNDFVINNFNDQFIIGVHYRGTDKKSEAPRVAYQDIVQNVKKCEKRLSLKEYKIFIATDEQQFLDYMQKVFPNQIIYQSTLLSTTGMPIHISNPNPYQHGEEALIDCLLLSKCHCLIRTSSNLSLWSSFFNPWIPTIELNSRYGQD